VKNPTLGIVAANFWDSAGGTADLITANKSCSVIVRETYNSISVGLSDPSQTLTGPGGLITVTLNRTGTLSSKDSEVTVVRTTPTIQFTANVSGAKGKTIHAAFSLQDAPVITSNLNMVGITDTPVIYQITASGTPTAYDATGLPLGMSVNKATGFISGTPNRAGTYLATIIATNATGRSGYATLTINVSSSMSGLTYPITSSGAWICPANVTSLQVECWGAGGAGGSASKPVSGNAFGGGGAGGSYAKKNSVSVVPGTSYTISIGAGGVSAISPSLTTVSGGDSSFRSGSVINCLAKGGAGGQSVISSGSGIVGNGGVGNSSGSMGDVLFAGGNGLVGQGSPTNTGGGGGGSAGILSVGGNANSYLGAALVSGGGAGGNGKDSTGNGDGSDGGSPGGGGGGARGSSVGSQSLGGAGGAGQVLLTVVGIAKIPQTITFGLDPATGKVGDAARTLIATSSSGLPVTLASSDSTVATITSGNTLNFVGAGTITITATQAGNTNYEAATSVAVILTVSPGGTTYATWNGGSSTVTSDLLMKYALGGATGPTATGEASSTSLTGTTFSMTALVRTDDLKLGIVPKATTSLAGVWDYPVTTTGKNEGVSQLGVTTGWERKVFTVTRSANTKIFMKIEVSYSP
jgi:hyaluronate lyase